MKWDGSLPIKDRFVGRMIAQAYVKCGCNMTRAVETELRPNELTGGSARNVASLLLQEPAVMYEIGVLMDRLEKGNAEKFANIMWEWLESEGQDVNGVRILSKADLEMKQTAARILARAYINEKKGDASPKPVMVDGLEEGLGALTGQDGKVM